MDWYSEKTPLTPDIKGRECRNAVVSPDKSEVAFLSSLTTGTDTNYYLFTIPVDGGNPVKVQTDYQFNLSRDFTVQNSHVDFLLDWR